MRSEHIPGVERPPFWCRRWFIETVGGVPPLAGSIFTTATNWSNPIGYAAAAVAVWIAAFGVVKVAAAQRQDKREGPEATHDGVYAAITTLHKAVSYLASQKLGYNPDIRGTFHRVVPPIDNPQSLQQIIPYVGSAHSGLGRTFSVSVGITGRAIRNREPYVMLSESPTEAEHREELKDGWGYTDAQARELTPNRISAIAIPVIGRRRGGQHVVGVIYFDSSEKKVFDDDTSKTLLALSDSISDFITERY